VLPYAWWKWVDDCGGKFGYTGILLCRSFFVEWMSARKDRHRYGGGGRDRTGDSSCLGSSRGVSGSQTARSAAREVKRLMKLSLSGSGKRASSYADRRCRNLLIRSGLTQWCEVDELLQSARAYR
jgi:hypothetical protein